VSLGDNLSTDSPVRRQKRFQSALRVFQRFVGSLWAGTLCYGGVMRERRCCDHWNLPRARLSDGWLSWPKFAKVSSGLVPHSICERRNWLLSLGHTAVQSCWILPRSPDSHCQRMCCYNPS